MYTASKERYTTMEYDHCGNSGLMLPKVSLGLWHNFGDTANFENMRKLCFTAFDSGMALMGTGEAVSTFLPAWIRV